jgi:Uma2 family endonuclease
MAAAPHFISPEQFESRYTGEKPSYEYWFGEAIRKSMPTSLHGFLQAVLVMLLLRRGWQAGFEIRLKLSQQAQPVPDIVAGHGGIQTPYPTKPFDLCVEILSPSDALQDVARKCVHYLNWGIGSVWIIDPESRRAYLMALDRPQPLELTRSDYLRAGSSDYEVAISVGELFSEFDQVVSR